MFELCWAIIKQIEPNGVQHNAAQKKCKNFNQKFKVF